MNEAIIIGCAGAAIGALLTYIILWRSAGKWVSKCADWQRRAETFAERLRDLEPREARFRQALGYYADDATWLADNGGRSPAFRDRGRVAAVAVAKESA
jgi:hypothetical protein